MIQEPPISPNVRTPFQLDTNRAFWRESGRRLAENAGELRRRGNKLRSSRALLRDVRALIAKAAGSEREAHTAWVLDNARLIQSTAKHSHEFLTTAHKLPSLADGTPRALQLARALLDAGANAFDEIGFVCFVNGHQEIAYLDMNELWALKPALQLEAIERLIHQDPREWPALVATLIEISETLWKEIFEALNAVDLILGEDRTGEYRLMDFDSREMYRRAVTEIAQFGRLDEREVARTAVRFAEREVASSDDSPGAMRRRHVGFFLIDRGRVALESAAEYRPPLRARVSRLLRDNPAVFYLGGIELLTLTITILLLFNAHTLLPISVIILLMIIPGTQFAVEFINNLVTALLSPRALPKLDFSDGIPNNFATIVAVPTLLLNEAQLHDLILDLEIRFLANRDPNLFFALVTDSPDSQQVVDDRDALVELGRTLIEGLNARHTTDGRAPFLMLHRHRVYNESEDRWMGWERKRGKLLDLNSVLRGAFDAFPVKVGDTSIFPSIRYVITLDSDTQLPRDSARKLIGAMAHPLNRAVVHPVSRMVVEGYGIIQPRIGISIQSAARSRLAALYSGQTGFDIYTRAVSDVYQDLFNEGIFTGKGIYDVDALRAVMERRFPENTLLSHDLIEGAYARAALASDIELIDDYPSHVSAFNKRKHRWVRGDWQILQWVRLRVPNYDRQIVPNPISLISRWKIIDNLRRSLLEPSLVALLLAGWIFLPGSAGYWTVVTMMLLFLPAVAGVAFALLRLPRRLPALRIWFVDTVSAFAKSVVVTAFSLIYLLHQAMLTVDAIGRSIARVFITRKRLLEWETAAEAESAKKGKSRVDVYLEWSPILALAIGMVVWLTRPASLIAAAPILGAWMLSPLLTLWLNRQPRRGNCELNREDADLMRDAAERICRFFREWSSPATHWLIPDNVEEDGAAELRLSPTNLGMLLNARVAAVHLNQTTIEEFAAETRCTLDSVAALPKYKGHLYNWYDLNTREPMYPRFVSTVDSGNLAASLWTLKQAALAFAGEPAIKRGLTEAITTSLNSIAETCDRMVREMDFAFLYNPRKKVLSVGYHGDSGQVEQSCYDLLATEARIASFVAIAKGDIPQDAWFHLGRSHTLYRGERVLTSWTGTMFEYLMPVLWMRHYAGTLLEHSAQAAVRVQREYARRKGVPWGISESACVSDDGKYGYEPFGIPQLASKRMEDNVLVISPYSTMLAAMVDPDNAVKNLRQMQDFGWTGRYGFYEAIDYRHGGGGKLVRSWMAHHQGMGLLAICNLMFDGQVQRYFHAEPHVMSAELLLQERVPAGALAEAGETMPMPEAAPVNS